MLDGASPAQAAPSAPGPYPVIDLVLVADDDPAARYVVRSQLQGAAREIAEVDRGASALEFVSRRRASVIVLDVSMPDLDGLEVLARLRATTGLAGLR